MATASLESAQYLPSNEHFSLSMNISSWLTLISSCEFTSQEQLFPSQKCNYSCRIESGPSLILCRQEEEEFGQLLAINLQLLANYYFSWFWMVVVVLVFLFFVCVCLFWESFWFLGFFLCFILGFLVLFSLFCLFLKFNLVIT